MADESNLSVAAFTALGTIVGYLGTEVASTSVFSRLLWPTRYYNTSRIRSILFFICVMPMGGPIHKAAVEALDKLMASGLWKGYCRGDMLGTIFYPDTGYRYVVCNEDRGNSEEKHARNGFWITVLRLIRWQSDLDIVSHGDNSSERADGDSEEKGSHQRRKVRARRPFLLLKLSRVDPGSTRSDNIPMVIEDNESLQLCHLGAIVASEMITLTFGLISAAVLKSFFSLWYLVPLALKLIAFLFHVRRGPIESPKPLASQMDQANEQKPNSSDSQQLLCKVTNFSTGFCLIEGPSELVLQFFRHYGHPVRNRWGFLGDRTREIISMWTVVAFILVYPSSLLAFIFAPQAVQWVWLGYQIFAILAMHVYRFCGGDHVGTTEESVASGLSDVKKVYFVDGGGHWILAQLENVVVDSVAEGRSLMEDRIRKIQEQHTK